MQCFMKDHEIFDAAMSKSWPACGPVNVFVRPSLGFHCSTGTNGQPCFNNLKFVLY